MQNQKIRSLLGRFPARALLRPSGYVGQVQPDLVERVVFPLQQMWFARLDPATGQGESLQGQFGLVPGWVDDGKGGKGYGRHCYNARCETVFEKPSFRRAILESRAAIPVDSFFEYTDRAEGKARRIRVSRKDGEPFFLAGIWERNERYGLDSVSIVTCEPMELLAPLHSRSPVILTEQEVDGWLVKGLAKEAIGKFLKPAESEEFTYAYDPT